MSEFKYLDIARKDIGLKEIKGPKHASRITQWLVKLGAWWRDDETPWCGVAVGGWLSEAGEAIPKAFYRASAWADWGKDANGPKLGAIAVLTRTGGGHVGIVTGVSLDGKYVRLLGGNQGDSVCEAWFAADRVTAYRLPVGAKLVGAVVASVGTFSKSEA